MNHYTRWLELKEQNPGKYARDIAGLMNISEAELAFARVTHDAWRMRGDIREILAALESVGETKCICRNEYAVHEQVGAFTNQHLNGHAGLILNPRAGFTSVSQSMGQCFPHQRKHGPWRTPEYSVL